jgi:hypothetical protein
MWPACMQVTAHFQVRLVVRCKLQPLADPLTLTPPQPPQIKTWRRVRRQPRRAGSRRRRLAGLLRPVRDAPGILRSRDPKTAEPRRR